VSARTIFKTTEISMHTSANTVHKVVSVRTDRRILMLAGLVLFIGCGRCVECVYDSGGSETICESEFDSPALYNLAVDNAEASGATCTSTGGL